METAPEKGAKPCQAGLEFGSQAGQNGVRFPNISFKKVEKLWFKIVMADDAWESGRMTGHWAGWLRQGAAVGGEERAMREQDLIEQWKGEEQQPFRGWDFSYLKGRYFEASPPWSYEERVRKLLGEVEAVLDMGTGGGEKLLEFKDLLPAHTVATEGWPPNLPVARENLEPHGIEVVPYDVEKEARMPFADGSFGLVTNRHEAFDACEVARILKPGGVFLTQQVDGRSMADLASVFGREAPNPQVTLAACGKEVEQAGLVIQFAEEAMGKMRFRDVGALVYYAQAAPWEFPEDFSVERYAAELLGLHKSGRLSFDMGHFIIQARKPA